MLRHYANWVAAIALAAALAACSSSGGSRGNDAEQAVAVAAATDDRPAFESESESASVGEPAVPPAPQIDLSIEPNLDEISERVRRTYDEALAAMQADDWVQAELSLEQLILEEPGFPGPYVNLALIYKLDGRIAEARAALEQAIAIAPGFAPANNELGVILREQGDFAGAQAAYERALSSEPDNAIAHLNLGILLDLYLRQPEDALEHYSRYQATRAEPDETVARWIVDLERRVAAAARIAQD